MLSYSLWLNEKRKTNLSGLYMQGDQDELSFLMDQIDAMLRIIKDPKKKAADSLPENMLSDLQGVRDQVDLLKKKYQEVEEKSGITSEKIVKHLEGHKSSITAKDRRKWNRIVRLKNEVRSMRNALKNISEGRVQSDKPVKKSPISQKSTKKRKKGRGDIGFGRGWKKL